MQQAVASPVFRSFVLGGLLLALSVAAIAASTSRHTQRLVLHAESDPDAVYLSAWRDGDVRVPSDVGERTVLMFTTLADVSDGCRWLGTETLVPIDAGRYAYRYDEEIVACDVGAEPSLKTPRTGFVTVE